MDNISPQNRPFYWSYQFISELASTGIEHIIISPGSRSTPLTLAAAACQKAKCSVILDERSAGYTALGIGKSTGVPSVLICTSGTAAANFYPSIIEASQSGVPLIVLTADRPPHLRDIGANQTIDQIKMYGSYPVWFHEAGEPVIDEISLKRLRRSAQQATYYARKYRGASHINFPFRKPLEPDTDFYEKTFNHSDSPDDDRKTIFHIESPQLGRLQEVEQQLKHSDRPLFIAGPEDPHYGLQEWAHRCSQQYQIPVLAEPGSQFPEDKNVISGFAGFLRNDKQRKHLTPDLILRIGHQPVSKGILQFLDDHKSVPHFHFTRFPRLQDRSLSTDQIFQGIPDEPKIEAPSSNESWLEQWLQQATTFHSLLEKKLSSEEVLTDGFVFNYLLNHLPDSWSLVLSNSLPVRDASLFGAASSFCSDTFVNRGTSGIDGTVSTAIGVNIGNTKPTLLLTGDLAFLHDTNGLLNQELLTAPLFIGIINNGGGSIFRMLPIAEHTSTFNRYFETPQTVSISHMGDTYHITHREFSKPGDLHQLSLESMHQKSGLHLLEFKTDPEASMRQRKMLWDMDILS